MYCELCRFGKDWSSNICNDKPEICWFFKVRENGENDR